MALVAEVQLEAHRAEIAGLDLFPDIFHHTAGQMSRLAQQSPVAGLGLALGHMVFQIFIDVFCCQGINLYSLVFAKVRNGMFHHIMEEGADFGRAEPGLTAGFCLQAVLQKMAHSTGAHPVQPGGRQADLAAVKVFYQGLVPQRPTGAGGVIPQLVQMGLAGFVLTDRLEGGLGRAVTAVLGSGAGQLKQGLGGGQPQGFQQRGAVFGLHLPEDAHAGKGAVMTNGNSEILIAGRKGRCCRFDEADARALGRTASGVRGINIDDDDEVVGLIVYDPSAEDAGDHSVLVVSEHGYGKRSDFDEYRKTSRGGKGVKTLNITEKTGSLVALKNVTDENDLMIINRSGLTIRMAVSGIKVAGRATQGVRLINIKDGDSIAAVSAVNKTEDETPEQQAEGTADVEQINE